MPVVLAFRRGDSTERAFWQRVLQDGDQREGDLEHATQLMARHATIDATIARAQHYGEIAKDALAIFPDTPYRQALSDLVDFCIGRTF